MKGCIKIISTIKKILIHFRTSIKITAILFIATLIMIGIVTYVYHPIYGVYLNGELIGYIENKANLQTKINNYMDSGDSENVAFVDIENLPQYKICLLKRDVASTGTSLFVEFCRKILLLICLCIVYKAS